MTRRIPGARFARQLLRQAVGMPRAVRRRRYLRSEAGRAQTLHRPEAALAFRLGTSGGDGATWTPETIARICRAFVASSGGMDSAGASMWALFAKRNRTLIDALHSHDTAVVARILADPASHEQFHGFDAICASYLTGDERIDRAWYALRACDALVRLGEATGAIRCANPEAFAQGFPDPVDPEALLVALDDALGVRIAFPNPYAGEIGIQTSRGIVSFRAVTALYQAWRTRALVGPRARVAEIGAGLGRVAYFCRQLGFTDYTIIDLPLTAACQAHFLAATLGEGAISLQGEPPAGVHIAAPEAFLGMSLGRFDLVVNVDSFTEMDREIATAYWKAITASARLLLSINHEANLFTVREMIAGDAALKQYARTPSWIRRGYVEELVTLA
jgi:hypothetical protein